MLKPLWDVGHILKCLQFTLKSAQSSGPDTPQAEPLAPPGRFQGTAGSDEGWRGARTPGDGR